MAFIIHYIYNVIHVMSCVLLYLLDFFNSEGAVSIYVFDTLQHKCALLLFTKLPTAISRERNMLQ